MGDDARDSVRWDEDEAIAIQEGHGIETGWRAERKNLTSQKPVWDESA